MCCGTYSNPEREKRDTAIGIVPKHAFSLLSIHELNNNGTLVKLVRIRNPWGKFEWKGEWSDGSKEWTPELDKITGHTNEDDGTFYMPFNRFCEQFE